MGSIYDSLFSWFKRTADWLTYEWAMLVIVLTGGFVDCPQCKRCKKLFPVDELDRTTHLCASCTEVEYRDHFSAHGIKND